MGYVVLHQHEPERAHARYYALAWAPAIIGHGWALARTWGPLASQRRQSKTVVVEDEATATHLAGQHLGRRFRHGYIVTQADDEGRALVARHRNGEGI